MRTIEVDFDVHQAIEAERRSFGDPPNAALRRLLGLGEGDRAADVDAAVATVPKGRDPGAEPLVGGSAQKTPGLRAWRSKGLILAEGTALMLEYSEVKETGRVSGGQLVFNGQGYSAPSPAAMDVVQRRRNGSPVSINGWLYVHAQRPGESQWRTLAALRSDADAQAVSRAAELGQSVAPYAKSAGWLTDEDVFEAVS